MSKYQEAKRYIDMIWSKSSWSRVDINWLAIEQIKELIDKETPNEPLWDNNGYRKCGTCKLRIVSTNNQFISYCSGCGQKVDWGDKE